jgi:hypothetical protein
MRDIEEHGMIASAMGWIGTVGTIAAYILLSRGRWSSASLRYSAINGVGGILCAAASAAYGAWPSTASNLLWSAVAAHSFVTTWLERRAVRIAVVQPLPARSPDPEPPTGPQPILLAA